MFRVKDIDGFFRLPRRRASVEWAPYSMPAPDLFSAARTKTGRFRIGVRRGWGDWQRDIDGFLAWLRENNFGTVDFGPDGPAYAEKVQDLGLSIGTIDLPDFKGLLSPDPALRDAAVQKGIELVERATTLFGPRIFLTAMIPPDPARPRRENFDYLVESYHRLGPVLKAHGARLVVEGSPRPGALCCTPEGYGEFFARCPSPALGVNFDPSHLVRMGIDPLRFLREFVGRVFHVHGKDTELLDEGRYRYGTEQEPTFAQPHGFGGMHWRYTLPGHGVCDWPAIFTLLEAHGYRGTVSIELEDETINGTEAGEKKGYFTARDFLAGC